ncbi:hypothetical protein BUY45_05130 [Staphylococcus devriesei]|uniref:site-specific DNA-methyltransferase (adenine-specific) n=1 Tax=Staphylococcus devriesei TaxID=586733 RepID=A0A2T4KPI0_9STAP|nr:hypothetical protein [Staphylococcus devriesei]PTF04204.1 hypothetical protein BUY45_05130 [Staphylococcus devriesei]PTF15174.1 hypothetical protein BUY48_06455 [Staphylococcus devriesei]
MIITDGKKIGKIGYVNEKYNTLPFKNITTNDIDEIVKALIFSKSKKLNSQNITTDFGLRPHSITMKLTNKLFHSLYNQELDTKTLMLFKEWQVLFHLSETDMGKNQDIIKRRSELSNLFEVNINDARSEYLALFSLQTTYAIIIKLIACKLLNKRLTNSENIKYFNDLTVVTSDELKEFLEKIEDGYSFSDNGIYNLLEGDFFSWYHLDSHWDYELYTLFNNLISKIEEYTTFTFLHEHTSIDVFKELYIEIMPKSIRHSLGEYFTPAWLADNVVQESINRIDSKNWKAIDPTCGSGIFITTLINKVFDQYDLSEMNSKEKENLLKEIYNRVKGIDINPLNVLTSRVSYMLAISPLIDEETTFEIPVYLGDSAIIPTTEKIENTECYVNTIETIEGNLNAIFPVDFVESSEFTPTLITAQKLLNIGILDEVISYLLEKISKYTAINVTLENKIQDLCNKIAELSSKQWDGIWLRIISNFLKAGSLKDLNIVVGNPPWVKWEYLPQNYAEKIKSVSLERHLFSGQTYMGAISLNICALIAHVNASYRLNEDGILAFLMPKTMMTQDSYEGFRNFILDIETNKRFYLQYAEDWEKSGHPFITMKDAFLSYYFKKGYIDYTKGVPLTNVIKKRGIKIEKINSKSSFSDVKEYFTLKNGYLVKLDDNRSGFTFVNNSTQIQNLSKVIGDNNYKARSGVEFTPKEVYILDFLKNSKNDDQAIFTNITSDKTTHKVNHVGDLNVETKYIMPLITGPTIERFSLENRNQYCIYPYNMNEKQSVSINELLNLSPKLAKYLLNQKSVIEKQSERSKFIAKGEDFYSLSKIGQYTYAPFKVVFRDNSKWRAALANPVTTLWGETKMSIPAKHAPYISQDKNGRDITEDESFYICGILNTPVIEEYMINTYSKRSFYINLNIKLPLYDSTNPNHSAIVKIVKKIYSSEVKIEEALPVLNDLYLKICDENN